MALFGPIMELFSSKAPPAPLSTAQQAAASNQQLGTDPVSNTTVPSSATVKSDGTTPVAIPAAGVGDKSPLENYAKIWEAPQNTGATQGTLASTMTVDPEKMMAAARTMDFTKGMDTELLTKAAGPGGDPTALAQLINQASQNAYAQGATASVKIAKQISEDQAKAFTSTYAPAMLRNNEIATTVNKAIPLSQDPAAAPIVNALRVQLSNNFPTASAEDIAGHVEMYLEDFARRAIEGKGGKVQTATQLAALPRNDFTRQDETDWSKFFSA